MKHISFIGKVTFVVLCAVRVGKGEFKLLCFFSFTIDLEFLFTDGYDRRFKFAICCIREIKKGYHDSYCHDKNEYFTQSMYFNFID